MIVEKSRKGSALLIVIGMLSFMVVSAVSFSIYMRQSRVPSSYLRRASSSRYLLKAALAHAIDRLDGTFASYADINEPSLGNSSVNGLVEGVYDDPYPGVGPSQSNDNDTYHRRNGDFWDHRVFTPFGMVSPLKTVSTMTLEGLAYVPPALINEARIYSRQTRTAMWRNLSYDMGRYAFSAIDVSDCFDINRVRAGERRTSAPDGRVNLSSLYDTNGSTLDQKLKLWENDDIPFVSVADFNIAAGQSPFTPFYKYIGSTSSEIYSSGDANTVSNALFITDTWFPATNSTTSVKRYDLAGKDQPFMQYPDTMSLRDMITGTTDFCKMLTKNIGVGIACLYDYLDEDSFPISFCLPTVEAAPMICGIGLLHNNSFTPTVAAGNDIVEGEYTKDRQKVKWRATPYRLTKLAGAMLLNGAAAFPFKRLGARDGYQTSFTGRALVRIFMGPPSMKCRVAGNSPLYPTKNDWNNSNQTVADGMVSYAVDLDQVQFAQNIEKQDDAVKNLTARLTLQQVNSIVYWLVEQEGMDEEGNRTQFDPYISFDGCAGGLAPRDADGKIESWWTAQTKNPAPTPERLPTQSTVSTAQYVPHIAVWMRLDSGSDTVDIVPARLDDDATWGRRSVNLANQADKFGGAGTPILEFRGQRPFTYSLDNDTGIATVLNGTAESFDNWAEFYAPDPRYNYAPEDWCPSKGNGAVTGAKWLDRLGAKDGSGSIMGKNGRDKDIFMFVSDQEYMQSIGELEFLPLLADLNGSQNFFDNNFLDAMSANLNGADFASRTILSDGDKLSLNGLASRDFMWRTYSAYDGDPIYDLRDGSAPVEVVNGTGDFRVNPFSSDTRVLMAALKDTPFDYYVASTNKTLNNTVNDKPANAQKYAFARGSTYAPLDDDELQDLASAMRTGFTASAKDGRSWESAFEELEWYRNSEYGDEQLSLFGVDLNNPLHGVDRKYLHAFWRDCFQNRQQLFLVFIRAEPLSVGGSASSTAASSQLGARGVALVWRDPAPPVRGGNRPSRLDLVSREQWRQFYQSYAPHRTRVLFYHQFE